jgi:hypothetical protein
VRNLINTFGEVWQLPHPAEWLSENGSDYIAQGREPLRQTNGLIQGVWIRPLEQREEKSIHDDRPPPKSSGSLAGCLS